MLCSDADAVAEGATELTAPNGTRIELVDADPPIVVPNDREMMKYSPPPSTRRLVAISAIAMAVGTVTR